MCNVNKYPILHNQTVVATISKGSTQSSLYINPKTVFDVNIMLCLKVSK